MEKWEKYLSTSILDPRMKAIAITHFRQILMVGTAHNATLGDGVYTIALLK